jgi:hypothetical protein
MFSLEFGATKESGSRAFIDPDDDEDYEDIPEKTFVDTYILEKKSNSVVILTTTKMAQEFVHTHLKREDKGKPVGKIQTEEGDQIATYTKISETIVSCNVNERLLTPNDVNNFASVFFNGIGHETKIVILHTTTEPFGSHHCDDGTLIRCLKSTAWIVGGSFPILEQPNILGGVSAAVLTLSELKQQAALLVCCFSTTSEIDSLSLGGFRNTLSSIGIKELSLLDQDVIKSRLKDLHQKPPSNSLYI